MTTTTKKSFFKDKKNWPTIALVAVAVILLITVIWLVIKMTSSENEKAVIPAKDAKTEIRSQKEAETPPAETITFCLRLDGREDRHLPALMGNQAQSIYANGRDGFNWSLPAASTGDEDYGILADGTIFAKEAFLEKWGMTSKVEIKAPFTGWQAEPMQRVDMDGEIAYVYNADVD